MTNIYVLFDPRSSDLVAYIGKGLSSRASAHWRKFLSGGTAVNRRVLAWFEKLRTEGVQPSWKFLEENVENWQERERYWIAHWRKINPNLCNVLDGGNEVAPDFSRLGGRLGGKRGGLKTHELHPQLASQTGIRTRDLYPELAVKRGHLGGLKTSQLHPDQSSEMGKVGGKRAHELHPGLAKKAGSIGGRTSGHRRYHLQRGIISPRCKLCQQPKLEN